PFAAWPGLDISVVVMIATLAHDLIGNHPWPWVISGDLMDARATAARKFRRATATAPKATIPSHDRNPPQVRTRLIAGGNWIRTSSSPSMDGGAQRIDWRRRGRFSAISSARRAIPWNPSHIRFWWVFGAARRLAQAGDTAQRCFGQG